MALRSRWTLASVRIRDLLVPVVRDAGRGGNADPGLMPIPKDVMEIHEEKLRRRATEEGVPFGLKLAVSGVYEMAEPVAKLLPDK